MPALAQKEPQLHLGTRALGASKLLRPWLAFFVLIACRLPGAVHDEAPLAPEVAATRPGQELCVAGEVKGVSLSPRSGVVYLNFGDAYPRQTLSVKIPREHPEVRKRASGCLGRPVRVTGIVEATDNGPVITLRDPSQIEFPPVAPGDALSNISEGAAYGFRLQAAVEGLITARDYGGLETLAATWRTGKTRMPDGRWLLPVFYGTLIGYDETDAAFAERIVAITAWRDARPEAVEPVIVLAGIHLRRAWQARGTGFADTVTEEGWRIFAERLALARVFLDKLGPRFTECPHAAAIMQKIALGQGWSNADYARLYEAAKAREPEYLPYYFNASFRLLPRWKGEPGDWERHARIESSGAAGKELLARLPWGLHQMHWNVLGESNLTWKEVREGFEALLRRYPGSTLNRSAYALFAGMAGDRKTCERLLDECGDKLDMGLWVNWANVDFALRWIADPAAPPPVIFRVEGGTRAPPPLPIEDT